MIDDVIEKYQGMPFSYGADCCTFAAECYEAQTGRNPMAELTYADEAEALALVTRYGGLENIMTAMLGEPYNERNDGDLCLANNGLAELAGVYYQGRCIVRTKKGLTTWSPNSIRKVWPCRKQ